MKRTFCIGLLVALAASPVGAAINNLCGWETGDATEVVSTSGTVSVNSGSPCRTGAYCLRANPTTTGSGYHELQRFNANGSTTGLNNATAYIRFYFRVATLPASNNEPIVRVMDSTPAQKFELRINSSGNLSAHQSDSATLGTGSTALSLNTWYRINIEVGTGASAAWAVSINGVAEISGSTANLLTNNNDAVRLGKAINRNGNSVDFYYDDYVSDGTTAPGAGAVQVMQIDGDGAATTWTLGAGSGSDWENVEEIPTDAADYLLSTLVAGDASTGTLESAASAGISGTVSAIKGLVNARSVSSTGTIALRIRSNGTNSNGSDRITTTTVGAGQIIHTVDPADSLAWSLGDLDNLEVGVVERDGTNRTRWTSGYVMVDFDATVVTAGCPGLAMRGACE